MNPSPFPKAAISALLFAAAASMAALAVRAGVAGPLGFHWMTAGLGMAWTVMVLRDAGWKPGSLVLLIIATCVAAAGVVLLQDFARCTALVALLVSAVRCSVRYDGSISAGADLALTAAAFALAALAATRTGSVFLATWSFFLLQAVCSCIPPRLSFGRSARSDPFDRAHRRAREALRRVPPTSLFIKE